MSNKDHFSLHYAEDLSGQYDCIDRLVLNAYCPKLMGGGGVRDFWRKLKGSDAGLNTAALMRFAGIVSKRVECYCKEKDLPFIHFQPGERKHEEAEKLYPTDDSFEGIFAIFCSRASANLWEVKEFGNGGMDIRRKKKPSLVNHYYFHIKDKQWGHVCIRMCAHPPFGCMIILNGHEWVSNNESVASLELKKESNCFTSYNNGDKLSLVADTLKQQGQLELVCQRWIYGCLWFALDYEAQRRVGFNYQFSVYQVEYSRNFLFKSGCQLDAVYQYLITHTRNRIDIDKLKTILGRKNRPRNTKSHASAPEVAVQTPDYNLTVFKINVGKLTFKLYDKGERTLRSEVVVHNSKALGCKKSLPYFEEMVGKLEGLMGNFMNNITYAHRVFIDDGTLENLSEPSQKGKKRLAGIKLTNKRDVAVMESVLGLALHPYGFGANEIKETMQQKGFKDYKVTNARYDMRKLREKSLIEKIKGKQKNRITRVGIYTLAAALCIWKQELKPMLAAVNKENVNQDCKAIIELEKKMIEARSVIIELSALYGVKFAA
jgi:hypothetical protein